MMTDDMGSSNETAPPDFVIGRWALLSDAGRWLPAKLLVVAIVLTVGFDFYEAEPVFTNLRQQWEWWAAALVMCALVLLYAALDNGEFRISARGGYVRHLRKEHDLAQLVTARKVTVLSKEDDGDGRVETIRRTVIELRGHQYPAPVLFNWNISTATFERLDEIVDRLNEAIAYQRSIGPEDRA